MGSMEKGFVHYCCVAKEGKILQAYRDNDGGGDPEMEKLAALCLEKAPAYHRLYSQTMCKRTYCFLMEDGFVYFAIANDRLGNTALFRFLEHYSDEFKKIAKKGSAGLRSSWKGKGKGKGGLSSANLNSVNLQEQLVPVVRQLISSLQNVGQSDSGGGNAMNSYSLPSDGYHGEGMEGGSCTKVPLLGHKSSKQEKKGKDHVITMRSIELEKHCMSTERGLKTNLGSDNTGSLASPIPLQKDMTGSMRRRYSPQSLRRKWCYLVRLVLAIDAAVCVMLLAIWLVICHGIQCIR